MRRKRTDTAGQFRPGGLNHVHPPRRWAVVRLTSPGPATTRFWTGAGLITFSFLGGNIVGSNSKLFAEVRCDSEGYIPGQGCVYWTMPGRLKMAKSDPLLSEAAQFYEEAQNRLTGPTGKIGTGRPLHRATDFQDFANRTIIRPTCLLLPKQPGQSCDEFPFAASAEGAASGVRGVEWDVKALNERHNSWAGTMLSVFYGHQRMSQGDEFYVQIDP